MTGQNEYDLGRFIKTVFISPSNAAHFFGYYDKTPLNDDDDKLLSHRVAFDGVNIKAGDSAEVGYFDLRTGQWNCFGVTNAFNWQQGAMLQWIGPDHNKYVIYNVQSDNYYKSVICDLNERSAKQLDFPIYSLHPNGKIAIGVNFERHYFCRAYHYEGIIKDEWDCSIHPEDGLFLIDLEKNASKRIISTSDLAAEVNQDDNENCNHWLEHVFWNKLGTRFAFYHRYGNGEHFKGIIYTANASGSEMYRLPEMDASTHIAWLGDEYILAWAKKKKFYRNAQLKLASCNNKIFDSMYGMASKIKKSIKNKISRNPENQSEGNYFLFRDGSEEYMVVGDGLLNEDGHPSYTKDGRFILTDTYADSNGYRHLLLYDTTAHRLIRLGRFYSPYNNVGYRCDLHPRFSRSEKYIIIDSAHSGKRQIMVLEVDWNKVLS